SWTIDQNVKDLAEKLRSETADAKARDREKPFMISDVCPLTPAPASEFAPGGGLQRFRLAPTADLPYPTPEMEKALLDERTKPPKTALVLADEPKDTYYVVALLSRNVKSDSSFKDEVYSPFSLGRARQAVLNEFQ